MIVTAPQNVQNAKAQILDPSPQDPVTVQRMGQVDLDRDQPPPYDTRQLSDPLPAQGSSSPLLQPQNTASSSMSLPSLPQRSISDVSFNTQALQPLPPPPRRPEPIIQEVVATNYLFLQTRKEPIQGTFHIDPDLPMVELDRTGKLSINRQNYNQKHKQKHRHHTKKNKRGNNQVPNAIFQTKQGDISLNLALVAPPLAAVANTLVQASSKRGNIDVKIPFINSFRYLNLEVQSQHGNILILIPRSFSGYVQAYSKEGKIVFLPHITAGMNIVSRRDREMQVAVGDALQYARLGTEWIGGTIHVASKKGHIYIGFINEDRKPIEETGFWKRVFDNVLDVISKKVAPAQHLKA